MHISISSLLLAALASTAAGLPSFHGPVNHKRDSPPFPTGDSDFKAHGTGAAFGTGSHTKGHHHHHHHTATGGHAASATYIEHHHTGTGNHHSSSATLAARAFSQSGAHSFTGSCAEPTATGGFAHESGSGRGFGTDHTRHHFHSGSAGHSGCFPIGTGFPKGGFPTPTRGGLSPTTFQTSAAAPSSAT